MGRLPPSIGIVIAAIAPPIMAATVLWLADADGGVVLGVMLGASLASMLLVLRMVARADHALANRLERLGEADDGGGPAPGGLADMFIETSSAGARLRRRWRVRLEARDRRLSMADSVVEAMADPLLLLDKSRRVVRANAAARALLGDRAAGLDVAVSLRNPEFLAAVDSVLIGGEARAVEVLLSVPVARTLDARILPFALESGLMERGEGSDGAAAVLVVLHDITALKRAEQMRADFVANASHELRTPLATLVGFIETLRGPARDDAPARERFLTIMQDQAGRMSRLVNDLLSLSRIEMEEHAPPTTLVEVGDIVRRVAAMLELRAAAKSVRLRLDIPADLPRVAGDDDQLTQVFQNLMDNAVKYGREQSEVAVTVRATGAIGGGTRMVSIAVMDRGDGIERSHLPRLTERFYRVDPARSRALGGTGLGLAIAKHIVNRHRGRLLIDSDVGVGSTFTVVLPAADARQDGVGIRPVESSARVS